MHTMQVVIIISLRQGLPKLLKLTLINSVTQACLEYLFDPPASDYPINSGYCTIRPIGGIHL